MFRNNWVPDLGKHESVMRVYALQGEAGLLICSWTPETRPEFPSVYGDEVWTGTEYEVAAHLIYEGYVREGLQIVKGARDRHNGEKRNPWNDFECGHHYIRATSSWSLITALSGYSYSAPEKAIGFAPKLDVNPFRCFWSTGNGWGVFEQKKSGKSISAKLEVRHGALTLKRFSLGCDATGCCPECKVTVKCGGKAQKASVECADDGIVVSLARVLHVPAGKVLEVRVG